MIHDRQALHIMLDMVIDRMREGQHQCKDCGTDHMDVHVQAFTNVQDQVAIVVVRAPGDIRKHGRTLADLAMRYLRDEFGEPIEVISDRPPTNMTNYVEAQKQKQEAARKPSAN